MKTRRLFALALSAALSAAVALPVLAQDRGGNRHAAPTIDQRQAAQERRIEHGARTGALTPRETARLERDQAHIQRMEDRARADGQLTFRERARIERAQDHAGRRIAHARHDRQRDFNHDGRADRGRQYHDFREARRHGHRHDDHRGFRPASYNRYR